MCIRDRFLTRPLPETQATGFVIPYGDCPLDGERVGEMVYIDPVSYTHLDVYKRQVCTIWRQRKGWRPAFWANLTRCNSF